MRANLPVGPAGRCVVIGAGKAAAAMAAAVDAAWPAVNLSGTVVTRYGHAVPAGRIQVLEAGHPVPDAASEAAARRILDTVRGLSADDLVLALISGGGSATLALPIAGLTLADKQRITRQLLASGAAIAEINAVRAHMSQVKGGRLAAAARPARVHTLLVSDVPGDDPATIASGPTIPGRTTPADALAVIDGYHIEVPAWLRARWQASATAPATGPELTDDAPDRCTHRIVASPAMALEAAARKAAELGLVPAVLGDALTGESRTLAAWMAARARELGSQRAPAATPAVLLSGGETTVTMGDGHAGRGGRNSEFLLALAIALDAAAGVWALACDSDGIDGTEDAAGAIVTPDTLARMRQAGVDPAAALRDHDSYSAFAAIGDLVITGPTLTNVNDFRAVLMM